LGRPRKTPPEIPPPSAILNELPEQTDVFP